MMSNTLRGFLSAEEIRERIQNRVRELAGTTPSGRQGVPQREGPELAHHRLNKLHLSLLTANSALEKVGAVNPRPAGALNQAVQLVKKCTRRALNWIIRPIQQFDSAVMSSLEEGTHVLEDFQAELRSVCVRLDALEAALNSLHSVSTVQSKPATNGASAHEDMDARVKLLQSRLEALAGELGELTRDHT